jgi:hypothetical protein
VGQRGPTSFLTKREVALAEFLHWGCHKVPLAQDLERYKNRDGKAARRVLRTNADYEAIRCDKKRPKPFKGKIDHSNIFQFGLGLGLANLTAEELAIFFATASALVAATRTMPLPWQRSEGNSLTLSNEPRTCHCRSMTPAMVPTVMETCRKSNRYEPIVVPDAAHRAATLVGAPGVVHQVPTTSGARVLQSLAGH